ncbi:MAG: hypothetical protein WCT22_00035 [Patescibacteria group bacterium]
MSLYEGKLFDRSPGEKAHASIAEALSQIFKFLIYPASGIEGIGQFRSDFSLTPPRTMPEPIAKMSNRLSSMVEGLVNNGLATRKPHMKSAA